MMPLVGITASHDFDKKLISLNEGYFKAVAKAGAIPVAVMPIQEENVLLDLVERLDGFLLSGGPDVDPSYFGESPDQNMRMVNPERDKTEIFIVRECFKRKKPVLGICRGIQVINIALGGSIYQDIQTKIKGAIKHFQDAPQWFGSHEIHIKDSKSLLYNIVKKRYIRVNSFHHQSVKDLAHPFKLTAISCDGVIEAIEAKDESLFFIGLQWHPEEMWEKDEAQLEIFKRFVEAIELKRNNKVF